MKKMFLALGAVALLASCATTETRAPRSNEYRIAGHPYNTVKDCKRKAPIGKFDRKCDVPLLGYRNFADPTIGVGAGNVGGFGLGGM